MSVYQLSLTLPRILGPLEVDLDFLSFLKTLPYVEDYGRFLSRAGEGGVN